MTSLVSLPKGELLRRYQRILDLAARAWEGEAEECGIVGDALLEAGVETEGIDLAILVRDLVGANGESAQVSRRWEIWESIRHAMVRESIRYGWVIG